MARILSRTLLRHDTLPIKYLPLAPLSFHHRHLSSKPQLIEIDLASSSSNASSSTSSSSDGDCDGDEKTMMKQHVEDMIHRLMLQKSTPDWLPFLPGSSFWVPLHKRPLSLTELIQKVADELTQEESFSLATCRGWPCSAYFIPESASTEANVEVKVLEGRMQVKVEIQEEETNEEVELHGVEDSDSKDQEE